MNSIEKKTNLILLSIVIGLAIIGIFIRLMPMEALLGTTQPIVSYTDSWYTVRQVEQILPQFPNYSWFDPMLSYPYGKIVDWGPVFPLFTSLVAFIYGASTQQEIISVISWIPIIFGLVLIPICFALGTIIWDSRAGWISAMLISVAGGETLFRSMYGDVDHHILEVLLTTSFFICYFHLLSFFKCPPLQKAGTKPEFSHNKEDNINLFGLKIGKRDLQLSMLAGFLYYLAIMTMPTCTLIAVTVGIITFLLPLLISWKHEYRRLLIINTIIFGVFIILFAISGIHVSGFSMGHYTAIHLFIPGFIIIESIILYVLSYYLENTRRILFSGLLLTFFGLIAILLNFMVPDIYHSFENIIHAFFGFTGTSTTIREMQRSNLTYLLNVFNFTTILSIFGLLLVLLRFCKKPLPVHLGALVWIFVYLGVSFLVIRYFYYGGLILVLLSAVCLIELFRKFDNASSIKSNTEKNEDLFSCIFRKWKGFLVIGVIIWIIAIISVQHVTSISKNDIPQVSVDDEWLESLNWLSSNTGDSKLDYFSIYSKEDFHYPENVFTVLSWWDSGHWILAISHLLPATSPFQDMVTSVAQFLLSESNENTVKIADLLHVKYVITTNDYLFDVFPIIQRWINPSSDVDPYYFIFYQPDHNTQKRLIPMIGLKSPFFSTMMVKLHVNDGSGVLSNGSALVTFSPSVIDNKDVPILQKLIPLKKSETISMLSQKQSNQEIVSLKYTSPITDTPALLNYRLIYESNGTRTFPGDVTLNNIKIFERVKGYTIPGTGTIEVPIVTNQGRHFTYRQQSENGTFTLPYSTTNSPYDVKATGPYRIIETNKTFDVDESQIEKYYT